MSAAKDALTEAVFNLACQKEPWISAEAEQDWRVEMARLFEEVGTISEGPDDQDGEWYFLYEDADLSDRRNIRPVFVIEGMYVAPKGER